MRYTPDPNRPDPATRKCQDCKEYFIPYSMAPSGKPVIQPPVLYTCLTCRSTVRTAG